MEYYKKISTVFERATDGTKKLIPGKYIDPTVEMCKDLTWCWTEKIDGANICVHWDGHRVRFGGHDEGSSIPATLVNRLIELFGGETNEQLFEQKFGSTPASLYGEGYGSKIASVGAKYKADGVDFILFDVKVGGLWIRRDGVEDIAQCFGIQAVPIVLQGSIDDAVAFVKTKPVSTIGTAPMEGLVGRPLEELHDRRGNRLIVKVKVRDFM